MYFLRPFNKDPESPWSVQNPSFNARWTGLAILVTGVVLAAFWTYQDYAFLAGAAYTNATFVKVTGSRIVTGLTRGSRIDYFGQYRYNVSGWAYFITQTKDEQQGAPAQFKPTIRIAYKTVKPAQSMIVYGNTLQADAKGSIADGLGLGVAGYCLIYLICAPVAAAQNRRRRAADADAQAAAVSPPADSPLGQTGKPSV